MSKKWIALFICTHIAVILLTALIVDGFFKEKSYAESERQRKFSLELEEWSLPCDARAKSSPSFFTESERAIIVYPIPKANYLIIFGVGHDGNGSPLTSWYGTTQQFEFSGCK